MSGKRTKALRRELQLLAVGAPAITRKNERRYRKDLREMRQRKPIPEPKRPRRRLAELSRRATRGKPPAKTGKTIAMRYWA